MKKLLFVSLLALLILPLCISASETLPVVLDPALSPQLPAGTVMGIPTAVPSAGNYNTAQSVTLSTAGSTGICYATDETDPVCASSGTSCTAGTFYATAIPISLTTTIKARSCYPNNYSSSVSSYTYTLTCATSAVGHGTVGAYPTCTITCSSGYHKSGNSCVADSGNNNSPGPASDTTAPTISNVVATPTSGTTATITWKTNESSLTWLNYGTSTAYGQQVKTTSYASSHSASLAGLNASTTYHYQVKSQDSSGNSGTAGDKTFTTLAAGTTAPTSTAATTTTSTSTSTSSSTSSTNPNVSQMTREQLIAFILQLIASMQTGGTTGTTTGGTTGTGTGSTTGLSAVPATFTFQTNLKFGMTLIDVKYLQIVLNSSADTKVALTGVGSSGYETTKFGNATLAAVKNFQTKYGIVGSASAAYGLVGPVTRVKLNSLLGK
jgi:murein L,D-transpeptidase YcbB/YkuD